MPIEINTETEKHAARKYRISMFPYTQYLIDDQLFFTSLWS